MEKVNINQAIKDADTKLTAKLYEAGLPMEDVHEIIELSNIVVDLNIHAFMMSMDVVKAEELLAQGASLDEVGHLLHGHKPVNHD